MKRIGRNQNRFDLLPILDAFARAKGVNIREESNQTALLEEIKTQLAQERSNDILYHGHRVQRMFAFVIAALGECKIVKEEDLGELYTDINEIAVPDFRVVTRSSREFLIEVKNSHTRDPRHPFKCTRSYLDRLLSYAKVFKLDLFVAIYWSQLKMWTLLSPNDFDVDGRKCAIAFLKAIERNKMSMFGDFLVGCPPALTLKFLVDRTKPHQMSADGQANFTVGEMQLSCEDKLIEDEFEKELAWFLMNYGDWPSSEPEANVLNGELVSISLRVGPEERANPKQHFETVGFLSEMISRQFNDVTAPEGVVKLLSPKREPATFGITIPKDYKGKVLPLWRFSLKPSDRKES